VYHKKPATGVLVGPFTITGSARTSSGGPVSFGVVQVNNETTNVSAPLTGGGNFSLVVNTLPAVVRVIKFPSGFPPILQTGELLVSTPAQSPVIIQVPGGPVVVEPPVNNVYNLLEDDDVVADFYLPYTCSSNCTPIQFVINMPSNQPPSAEAGERITVQFPGEVTLRGSGDDPDGDVLTYLWTETTGKTGFTIETPDAAVTRVTGLATGRYIFQLTVSDGKLFATDTVEVIITPAIQPPVANAGGPLNLALPTTFVQLNGTVSSNPGNRRLTYEWTSSGTAKISNKTSLTAVAFNLTQAINYNIRLTVTNDIDLSDTDDLVINVTGGRRDNCETLGSLENGFNEFLSKPPEILVPLRDSYPAFAEIDKYFRDIKDRGLSTQSIIVQLRFFAQPEVVVGVPVSKVTTVQALEIWLNPLFDLIQVNAADSPERENQKQQLRALTMDLYNILVSLAAYITCIQRGPNEFPVNTTGLFKIIQNQVSSLDANFTGKLNDTHLLLLMELRALFDDEIHLIEITNQQVPKAVYLQTLQQVRSHMDTLFLF
ncbi:MAG: hypothetical protein H7Y01_15805, partial [Ferruginibacter sp.]|nr:hypothetical protein [Chitinophagaceae bacterium]